MNPPASNRGLSRRPNMRRAVVLMPNGLTLFNLFCGIYAIILAIRGEVTSAPAFIVLGGIADTLDGRVARATGTGSRFGEELDSLVDAISFGFAPALIVYIGLQKQGTLEWLLVFIFTACAVMRLARFNVEQAGRKKTHFHGLPSPAAGLTLATYFWFSQTPLYNQAIILFTDSKTLSVLPWPTIMRMLMAILAALMISDVPYPTVPSIGFRSLRQVFGTFLVLGSLFLLIFRKEEFIFPALLAYVLYGAIKWVVLGFLGRSHSPGEVYGSTPRVGDVRVDGERRASGRAPTPAVSTPAIAEPRRDEWREERREERHAERAERQRSDDGSQVRRKRRRRGRGANRPQSSSQQSSSQQSSSQQSQSPPSASGPRSSTPPNEPPPRPSDPTTGPDE